MAPRASLFQRFLWATLALTTLFFMGCQVRGLSGPGRTTTMGYDLTLLKAREGAVPSKVAPYHVAVVQAGSLQPDPKFVETLAGYGSLFSEVSALPARIERRDFNREVAQRDPEELMTLARGVGADLLIVLGGQSRSGRTKTPLTVLDLSLVGHYAVPSQKVQSKVEATAMLVSVQGSTVLESVSHHETGKAWSPSVSSQSNLEAVLDRTKAQTLQA